MDKTKLKIIVRDSALAQKQAEEVMQNFPEINYQLIKIKSLGDKQKNVSLLDNAVPDDFFTRELDAALAAGRGEIALHSAKDLPRYLPAGLSIVAIIQAFDRSDVLVSFGGRRLRELPPGALVGTSSGMRKAQLASIRPDLKVVPVRGTIFERLQLIDDRSIDALIVAGCALRRLGLTHKIAEKLSFKTHPMQGSLAVVAKTNRADLATLFSKIDVRRQFGKVFLVGAINLENLTIKADAILKSAGIIFYDDLLDPSLLQKYAAPKKYVGKRKNKSAITQEEINELMYQAALGGKRVVRLKGGDPLIFSRGGEEIKYLLERMVAVEVVPGVSVAQVAAANNLIPLTMRGVANQLHFLSGHTIDSHEKSTQIYFMGASKLKEISAKMRRRGFNPDTPAAIVCDVGKVTESIILTTLGDLSRQEVNSPALLIFGDTVGQYQRQEKVLFLGLDPSTCRLNKKLVHYPLIAVQPVSKLQINLAKYDALLFTSKNGVASILPAYNLAQKKIIAIGPQTKRAIENFGYPVDFLPQSADSLELAKLIQRHNFRRILYPTSQLSKNVLHGLNNVEVKVTYRTRFLRPPRVNLKNYSGLVFSSASTVKAFFNLYKKIPSALQIYVYGNLVAAELKKRGYKNVQTVSP